MTIYDVFNNSDAIINDPNEKIHTSVKSVDKNPDLMEYNDMLDHLDPTEYPLPDEGIIHHSVSLIRSKLKPIYK